MIKTLIILLLTFSLSGLYRVSANNTVTNSVLATGNWVMIKTTSDGIYRLTYQELIAMGIQNPENVRIFGNSNRMLPKMNSETREIDLTENRIFQGQNYILFYGLGPVSWNYNQTTEMFEPEKHLYSDGNYYFITSLPAGKERIGVKPPLSEHANQIVTSFDDYIFHKNSNVNLLKSGRDWFGEHFRVITEQTFNFNFPNALTGSTAKIKWRTASRSPAQSQFGITINQSTNQLLTFPAVNLNSYISGYAETAVGISPFTVDGNSVNLKINYQPNNTAGEGWLDYLLINLKRELKMSGNQMHFRSVDHVGGNNIGEFRITVSGAGLRVWDVSDPVNIEQLTTNLSGDQLIFTDNSNRLKQYVVFDNRSYLTPEIKGKIPNQNLRAKKGYDMVIVSHPLFKDQANRLAQYRKENDNLKIVVVTPQEIYNEFSSGKPDVTAIRDFMRHLYKNQAPGGIELRYLLLFGNGAYDNRPGDPSGINYIPTYQSPNSLRPTQSFVSDDFFGLLDDNEGEFTGLLDIGIGRFPVSTPTQAKDIVDKTIAYSEGATRGDWQNIITFIGDDGDNHIHMRDADLLSQQVKENYPQFNLDKIYLDAWPKTGTSLGQRYPGVNRAISERVRKGSLIINYTGHGNELRLADENILDVNDAISFTNFDRLPVFMTATCEFSRFDNPGRVSAGEMLLLNPGGGGVALFSTTRLVYATPNFFLNQNFYRFALEREINGKEIRLGDIMRLTKINSGHGINKRNFTLLGDPSLRLAVPAYRVRIEEVNGKAVSEIPDTLKALGFATISGIIEDNHGNPATGFNGTISNTIFDKSQLVNTLGNDGTNQFSFKNRTNTIYKGEATVTNGSFNFSFIVPKDIAYHYGYGKISSYAISSETDASGYFNNIIIGGSNPDAPPDYTGPEIELFMNNRKFVSGGLTNQNPVLLAYLNDESGINTTGAGIGHDITLILNNDPATLVVLNDYYTYDENSYNTGRVIYPFTDLDEGNYILVLKAWDIYNNSSEATLEFTVSNSAILEVSNLINFPNPFSTETRFQFEHNQPGEEMQVSINIFTTSGTQVKTINKTMMPGGYISDPVFWDGRSETGAKIIPGLYLYRVSVKTSKGMHAEKYGRLIIIN